MIHILAVCSSLVLFSMSGFAQVSEQEFVEILSEPQEDQIYQLNVQVDENFDILGFAIRSDDFEQLISTQELDEGEVLLLEVEGREALFVGCEDCNWQLGGTLAVRYLYSGITGQFNTFLLDFERQENLWVPYSEDEEVINLTLKPNKFFGRIIGVKEVLVNDY